MIVRVVLVVGRSLLLIIASSTATQSIMCREELVLVTHPDAEQVVEYEELAA